MKIIFAIPLVYSPSVDFWNRDLGLVVLALRKIGVDAWFCTLSGSENPDPTLPLITASRNDLSTPEWWKLQNPDAVVLNTWSATRYDDIRSAALSLSVPLIEKLDTDGVKSPRIYPLHSIRRNWVDYNLMHPLFDGLLAKAKALARFLVTYTFPSILDKRMIKCMEKVPVYAAETPIACSRVRRFLKMYNAAPMPEVVTIPHPVDTEFMGFSDKISKQNQIIAVGRWDDAVKGWNLLKKTVRILLEQEKDWSIFVAGIGAKDEGQALEEEFPRRFKMLGRLSHDKLNFYLKSSKIYLLTSHSETFNIAGAEALCCGCSVVGPAQIPSSSFFSSYESGTVSYIRSPEHMADALGAEISEWRSGARNPLKISNYWIEKLGADSIAKRYINIISNMNFK